MKLFDSEKVYQYIKETPLIPNHAKGAVFLDLESNATYLQDAVARDCFDRILKENDVMRDQLAQIGKKPGDYMDGIISIDEGIKLGAELAAMHGSDATSQELEKAYLEGVDYGMKRRDVKPMVRGKWISHDFVSMGNGRYTGSVECSVCHRFLPMNENFCPSCGADCRGDNDG